MAGMRETGRAGGTDPDGAENGADDLGGLEIEVTDLRTGATVEPARMRMPWERLSSGSVAANGPNTFDDADNDDDDQYGGEGGDGGSAAQPAPARLSTVQIRARTMRGALVAGAVVLVLVGLLASNPGVSGALRTRLFPPTPTLAPGANVIWVRNTVPWGTLKLDGRAVPQPDTFTPIMLGRGQHSLSYDAAPFRALRCTVSVPGSPSDTCPQALPDANQLNPPSYGERLIDFGAVPEKLPASDFTALLAALQRNLDTATTTTQLAPGDHYGTPDGQVRVAQRQMSVTLAFVVVPATPSGSAASFNGESCNPLCVLPNGSSGYVTGWPVSALVNPEWRYTDDSGTARAVTSAAPGTAQATGFPGNLLTFSVQWTSHGWQATLPEINNYNSQNEAATIECDTAIQGLPSMGSSIGANNGYGISTGPNSAATPLADGCAIAVIPQNGNGGPNGPSALLLLRCGALMAANDVAHQYFPSLPLADEREAALAHQLGTTLGQ